VQLNHTAVIIQARSGSQRFPKKVLQPFYGRQSLFETLYTRLKAQCPVPIVLATTTSENDRALEELGTALGIPVFRGSEQNVLQRFIDCARQFQIDTVVRVCSDNPFLDPQAINQLLNAYRNEAADYISFRIGDKPSILTHFGFWAELVRVPSLEKVQELTRESLYLEHVTNYLYTHPEQFKIRWLPGPEFIDPNSTMRLTVDTRQDFEVAQRVYLELMKGNPAFGLKDVVNYVEQRPELLAGMKQEIERNSK